MNAWARSATGGSIESALRREEAGAGFAAAYIVSAAHVDATLAAPISRSESAGDLYSVTFDGPRQVAQEFRSYRFYGDAKGVRGVALPLTNGKATLYVFTADDPIALHAFELALDRATWTSIADQFHDADGNVFGGFTLNSAWYTRFRGFTGYSFGGEVLSPSFRGAISAYDRTVRAGVTAAAVIDNPTCCTDAVPFPTPANPLAVRLTAPMLVILQDASGLTLLTAAS